MSAFSTQFNRSAWRLETRPWYGADAEEFNRAQAGRPPTLAQQERRQEWLAELAVLGRHVGRVLVVTFPLSDYWHWRIATAAPHIAAGEDIRLVDRRGHPRLAGLGEDFWLFDDERVLVMDYDLAGEFLGARPVTDPALVAEYRHRLEWVRSWSVPLVPGTVPAA